VTGKKTLRAAMVGLRHGHMGSIGTEHPGYIQTFKGLDDVEVVAYFEDTETERLAPVATEDPGAKAYTSLDDLIANEEFDVAMVGLPANEVPAAGIKLAEAGKHFYMEKQFARNADDLAELARVVKSTGVKVFAGYPWRFHPAMKEIRSMIDQGLLGRPLSIETQLVTSQVRPGSRDPGAFSYRDATQGGGIVHHLGGHHIEAMRFLMGEVKAVQAMVRSPVGYIEAPLEDVAAVALEYENGALGTMHQGFFSPPGLSGGGDGYLAYRGLEGWAEWKPFASYGLKAGSTSQTWSGAPIREFNYTPKPYLGYGEDDWFHNYVDGFMEAIRNDTEPALGVMDALAVARVIDAIYESSRSGRRIDVEYGL
jgi:UDP-N-acetyl-2-amino-2-deoxyglucuronate dehydrogenase